MPGNPRECREHAANCRQLAQSASGETAREKFLALASAWEGLASELESAQMFLLAMDDLERKESLGADRLEWLASWNAAGLNAARRSLRRAPSFA